jgi:hypothetical protein
MKKPNFKSTCKIKVRKGLNMEMWDKGMKSLCGEDGGSNGSLGEEWIWELGTYFVLQSLLVEKIHFEH